MYLIHNPHIYSHEPEGALQANCKDTKKKMFDLVCEKQNEIQYVALNSSLSPIPKAMYVLGNFISVITGSNSVQCFTVALSSTGQDSGGSASETTPPETANSQQETAVRVSTDNFQVVALRNQPKLCVCEL